MLTLYSSWINFSLSLFFLHLSTLYKITKCKLLATFLRISVTLIYCIVLKNQRFVLQYVRRYLCFKLCILQLSLYIIDSDSIINYSKLIFNRLVFKTLFIDLYRQEARDMFYHAYNGEFPLLITIFVLNYTSGNQLMIIFLSAYMDNAFPADELMPLSCKVCMNSSRLFNLIDFISFY